LKFYDVKLSENLLRCFSFLGSSSFYGESIRISTRSYGHIRGFSFKLCVRTLFIKVLTITAVFEQFKIHTQKLEIWYVFIWKFGAPVIRSHHFPEAALH